MSSHNNKVESFPLDETTSSFRQLQVNAPGHTERGHWNTHAEFLLSCIGLSVGLGNLWRFPYKANEHGGAAFLLSYILLQLVVGMPIYFMELAIGQYSGLGPIGIFRCNPSAKGVGIAMVIITAVIAIFYNVIMAYTVYYMCASFINPLPWKNCKNEWITKFNCYTTAKKANSMPLCGTNKTSPHTKLCKCSGDLNHDFNLSAIEFCPGVKLDMNYEQLKNGSIVNKCTDLMICTNQTRGPSHFYFYLDVIRRDEQEFSHKLTSIGEPIWYLVLCLLAAWIVIVLCLLKGIKSIGKAVYFTATFPYFVIFALLIRSATLDGSLKGIQYFLIPDWNKFSDIELWKDAGVQMFFSLSISYGAIITLGSYNRFRNNIYIDALVISSVDLVTSLLAGIVVFSTLGAMSYKTGIDIQNISKSDFGLVFVTYPEALSQLPTPHFWSVIFFFMLFTLGVDSMFAVMENLLTSIVDEFPKLLKYKMFLTIGSGVVGFFLGLPIVTPGGSYLIAIMNDYGVSISFYVICFSELAAISWLYGAKRLLTDINYMLGFQPKPVLFWMATWTVISPIVVFAVFIAGIINFKRPMYSDNTSFGDGANIAGSFFVACIISPIFIVFVKTVYQAEGNTILQKMKNATSPSEDWRAQRHETLNFRPDD